MSQPKSQLETFKSWAGRDSDISYYLNSHHVDVCEWIVKDQGWLPTKVSASAAQGTAVELGCVPETEDTITLLVTWSKPASTSTSASSSSAPSKTATSIHTSSWTAPQKAGVHSNQYFHYLAAKGEIRINQAKRGYDVATDEEFMWYNPFYMRYSPDERGDFGGQAGYGYVSFEKFVDGCTEVNAAGSSEGDAGRKRKLAELDARGLPTLGNTVATTAILEAGRRALDERREVGIRVVDGVWELV